MALRFVHDTHCRALSESGQWTGDSFSLQCGSLGNYH